MAMIKKFLILFVYSGIAVSQNGFQNENPSPPTPLSYGPGCHPATDFMMPSAVPPRAEDMKKYDFNNPIFKNILFEIKKNPELNLKQAVSYKVARLTDQKGSRNRAFEFDVFRNEIQGINDAIKANKNTVERQRLFELQKAIFDLVKDGFMEVCVPPEDREPKKDPQSTHKVEQPKRPQYQENN